ncbi:ParB/RepB/Spo0J family partition protein [Erysipelothrix aquatica]|uniref:ParB/RepB/Spo0J family partition protein n=1 Tax=Erysipelothrix aquatica TaxID=2683714 RepID=UPI001357BB6E|nr:ParB N-terminal domain-containing protein [Erysipelothrix aquatica]
MSKSNIEKSGLGIIKFDRKEPIRSTRDIMNDNGDSEYLDLHVDDIVPNINNPYPVNELEELIESIKLYGLQQNLVVKPNDDGNYDIFAGHKRYTAIRKILDEDTKHEYVHLETVKCLVLSKSENDIISHIRKHETNTLARSLLKMSDEEKLEVVEDFMYWLDKARSENLEINGKPIKGKTRDIVAERFGISTGKAGEIISLVKNKEMGAKSGTPPEISDEAKAYRSGVKITKQLNKIYDELVEITETDNSLLESHRNEIKRWFTTIEELL